MRCNGNFKKNVKIVGYYFLRSKKSPFKVSNWCIMSNKGFHNVCKMNVNKLCNMAKAYKIQMNMANVICETKYSSKLLFNADYNPLYQIKFSIVI